MNKDKFDSLRLESDPIADEVVARIISTDKTKEVNEVLKTLFSNKRESSNEMHPLIVEYFNKTAILPKWIDPKKIKLAQKVYSKHGPEINMILLCGSLPYCYSCANGAEVLFQTGRLLEDKRGTVNSFTTRLVETAQYLVHVLEPESFTSKGKAIVSTQKIRLVHAAIRYFIGLGVWDKETLGAPINQQDLIGCNLSFSVLVIDALHKLGIDLEKDEANAYYHLWKVIGHLIGIQDDCIPNKLEDGRKLMNQILEDQSKKSIAGIELEKACIEFMEYVIPGNMFDSIASMLTRFISGDEIADKLEVPNVNDKTEHLFNRFIKSILSNFDSITDESLIIRRVAIQFNKMLTNGIINYFSEGRNVHFEIPKSLKKDWAVETLWEDTNIVTPSVFGHRVALQRKLEKKV